jgi:WD40 repeat protein
MTTSSSSSLSNLNDDVLCHALEYVNSYGVLHAMSSTNIRAHVLIEHSNVGARMERRLYLQEFGANDSLSSTTGFVARPYKALSNMKQKLLQQGNRDDDDRTSPPADKTTNLRTLGILSPKDENDATAYDHSFYFRENQQCIGYFGWKKLSEHNVVVWGDFEGIRILPTTLALSYHSHDQEDDGAIQKVGQSSSVLTVLVVPWSSNNNDEEENDHSKDSTLLFLGFASGKVSAVRCDPDGTFNTITETFKHTDEVTSLALLPNTATLVSGGMDGKVFLYPDACAKKPSLQNEKELSTPASVTKVLCLSATALNTHHVALCIFGEPQVTILHKHHTDETWKNDSRLSLHQPTSSSSARQIVSSEPKRATRVSMLKSSDDAVAVGIYGTNHGSLHKFEMRLNDDGDDDASRILFEDVITKSQAHLGAVDWIEVVGDVIFTSGGYQGMVQAWRVSDLSPLATIQAHPGRNFHPPPRAPQPQSPLTCSVVSIMPCHEQQSLTCLCRDGSIYQWKYANEEEESSQCVFGAAAFLRENYFEDDCQVTEIEEEEEYCKEKQPWTPERMDKFMENADAANRRRMQMRIMQAALHHGNESPPLAAMFDRHADVPQCHNCKSDGIGVSKDMLKFDLMAPSLWFM